METCSRTGIYSSRTQLVRIDKEFLKTIKKQASGIDLQQNRNLLQHNTTCTNRQGISQDDKEAGKLYRLAAKLGFSQAQNNLGVMYTNGQGVPKDSVSAHMWFNVAASNGNFGV